MAQFFIGQQYHETNTTDAVVEKTLTNNTSNNYEIISIHLEYLAGSTVTNRWINIKVTAADGVITSSYLSTTSQIAAQTVIYDFGLSSPTGAAVTPIGSVDYSRQNLKPMILSPQGTLTVTSLDDATGLPVLTTGEEMDVTWTWLIDKPGVVA